MRLSKFCLGLVFASLASIALAWPTKPVKLLVGFPAGSSPDMTARTLAEVLAKSLGQPVIVENRPGASGNIAADLVAKATDDHTLGIVINGNLTSAKLLNPKLPFDPAKDFALISEIATAPLVLVTTPDQPSGDAFFKAAREGGAKWNFASVGNGSVGHLGVELLLSKAQITGPVHVPYPGNPQVITALLGNQVQMALVPPGLAMAQVRAGKLKAVGISSAGRSTLVPELAPIGASLASGFEVDVWNALVGPATLSKAAKTKLAATVPDAVRDPATRARLFQQGWQAVGSAPEGLAYRVKLERERLGAIIALRGIKVE